MFEFTFLHGYMLQSQEDCSSNFNYLFEFSNTNLDSSFHQELRRKMKRSVGYPKSQSMILRNDYSNFKSQKLSSSIFHSFHQSPASRCVVVVLVLQRLLLVNDKFFEVLQVRFRTHSSRQHEARRLCL